jgi:membrane peptidoglycan carboxypeptidase
VPAVKTLEYAGLESVYALAKRMGLTTLHDMDFYGPAFTLGGVDVSLLDMTYAFSVLANQGEQAGIASVPGLPKGSRTLDPVAVLKVENVQGKTIWQAKPRKERLVPANAVYLVQNVLSDDAARVSMFGAGSPLNLPGRRSAVKSGLSDDARDAWAIGFTPQLVTGVWVGNANNKPMPGATSTFTAAPIWREFMTAALQGQPAIEFPVPDGIQQVQVCATTGQAPTRDCPRVVTEVFLAGHTPAGTSNRVPTPQNTKEPEPSATPRPQETPTAPAPSTTRTPSVTPTPRGTQTAQPTRTPRPTERPSRDPTATPRPGSNSDDD